MNKLEEYRKKAADKLLAVITKEQREKILPMIDGVLAPSIFMSLLEVFKDAIENMYDSAPKEVRDIVMEDFITSMRDIVNPPKDDDEHE